MTNKDKREYISYLIKLNTEIFKGALQNVRNPQFKNPDTLFKYRKFDKYSFETLDNNYIYFCPPNKLDDPFECCGFVPKGIVNENYRKQFVRKVMKFLLDKTNLPYNEKYDDIIKNFEKYSGSKEIDRINLLRNLPIEAYTDVDFRFVNNFISNVLLKINHIAGDENIIKYISTSDKGDEKVGIFSLGEEKDSRIMWSLYADNYRGYCVEYDFKDSPYRNILFPVIYKKKFRNDIVHNAIMLNENILIENFTQGAIKADYSFGLLQFLTKDLSWKAQKEWRLIFNPDFKGDAPKIKAIYLGCKASRRNISKIKKYSKEKNFDLYRMEIDEKRNKLSFKRI